MHKWQLLGVVGLSCMGLSSLSLASDADSLLPTNDSQGCAALIQRGAVNPPEATSDLERVKLCTNLCDQLYQSLGDAGRIDAMLRGSNYCRKSLNNLYFSSVAQTINDQLNQQSQQQQADQQQAFLDKVTAMIKQNQQNQPDAGGNTNEPAQATPPAQQPVTTPPPPEHIGPPEGVNW